MSNSNKCPVCDEEYNTMHSASRLGRSIDIKQYSKSCVLQNEQKGSRAMKPTKDYSTRVFFHE